MGKTKILWSMRGYDTHITLEPNLSITKETNGTYVVVKMEKKRAIKMAQEILLNYGVKEIKKEDK